MKGEAKQVSANQMLVKNFLSAKISKEKIYEDVLEQPRIKNSPRGEEIRKVIYSNRTFHQKGVKKMGFDEMKKYQSDICNGMPQKKTTIVDFEFLDD